MKKISGFPGFFAISGFPLSGKTSVTKEVARLFQERRPDFPVAFLPKDLVQRKHPLNRSSKELERHAVSRLFRNWADLNEECLWVRKQLEAGRMTFVDGFGLTAYLDAIACNDSAEQKNEAFQMHHSLVSARVVTQRLRPPEYLILPPPRIPPPQSNTSELAEFHCSLEYEMGRYFSNTGQAQPIFLKGHSVKSFAEEIFAHVLSSVSMRK